VLNGFFSHWRHVLSGISGIPQGSILGSLLFIVFINNLADSFTDGAELFLYADDAKLFKLILSDTKVSIPQADILDLKAWLDKWL